MSPPLLPVIPDAQQLWTVIAQIIAKGYVFYKNSQKELYGSKCNLCHTGCRTREKWLQNIMWL